MSRHRDLATLQRRYFETIDALHRQHDYTETYTDFAKQHGLIATYTTSDQAFKLYDRQHININFLNPENRRAFSGWHEVCHKIIGSTNINDDGVPFRDDILECCGYDPKSAYDIEEDWCNLGASHFLFPTHFLETVKHLGFVPTQAIQLARLRVGSIGAASRKVASLYGEEAFVFLVDAHGEVKDAFSVNSRYASIHGGYRIDSDHPILHPHSHLEVDFMEAIVPFRNSATRMKMHVAVARDHQERRLAFFTRQPVVPPTYAQPGLFDLN